VRTIADSFQRKRPFGDAPAESVGFDNYDAVLQGTFGSQLGLVLLMLLLPLFTLLVLGPLVAWLAHRSGTAGRRVTRMVLVPLLVIFTPVGVAVAWLVAQVGEQPSDSPRLTVAWQTGLILFGALLAVSVTVFLAVLRRRADERRAWSAGIIVGALLGLAAIAYGLQTFDVPSVLTRGGRDTATPLYDAFRMYFAQLKLGEAAAALTLICVPIGVVGIVAVLLVAVSGLRVRWTPGAGRPTSAGPLVATVLALVGCLALAGYALWPWLQSYDGPTPRGLSAGTVALNTWLPPLISAVVGVAVAALAGFGIGALRPLGRASELLLLPFAPWLFITPAVQAFLAFEPMRDADALNTMLATIPPVWVNIPALVLFTVLFRGLGRPWRTGTASLGGSVLLPALPMVLVAVVATWLINAQSLAWPLVFYVEPDNFPGPVAVYAAVQNMRIGDPPVSLALPIAAIIAFALLVAALQWWYMDRLSIRAGAEDPAVAPQ
jgi:hypothetical protein